MKKRFVFPFLLLLASCSSAKPYSAISPDGSSQNGTNRKYPLFVAEVNDRVLAEVKVFTQTPASQKEFKEALKRMKRFEPKVAPVFEKASLPPQLLALPIVQTGYTNLRSTDDEAGVGVWKFTPYIANAYGLIGPKRDDRLVIVKETQAARAYIEHLFDLFHDWRFVLIAYCEGEGSLTAAIAKKPSEGPWEIEPTIPETHLCLARTMAALYLIDHPELLK